MSAPADAQLRFFEWVSPPAVFIIRAYGKAVNGFLGENSAIRTIYDAPAQIAVRKISHRAYFSHDPPGCHPAGCSDTV